MKCVRYRVIQIHEMFLVLTLPIYPAVYRAQHSVVAHHLSHRAVDTLRSIRCDISNRPVIPSQGLGSPSPCPTAEPYLSQGDHCDVGFFIRGIVDPLYPHLVHVV